MKRKFLIQLFLYFSLTFFWTSQIFANSGAIREVVSTNFYNQTMEVHAESGIFYPLDMSDKFRVVKVSLNSHGGGVLIFNAGLEFGPGNEKSTIAIYDLARPFEKYGALLTLEASSTDAVVGVKLEKNSPFWLATLKKVTLAVPAGSNEIIIASHPLEIKSRKGLSSTRVLLSDFSFIPDEIQPGKSSGKKSKGIPVIMGAVLSRRTVAPGEYILLEVSVMNYSDDFAVRARFEGGGSEIFTLRPVQTGGAYTNLAAVIKLPESTVSSKVTLVIYGVSPPDWKEEGTGEARFMILKKGLQEVKSSRSEFATLLVNVAGSGKMLKTQADNDEEDREASEMYGSGEIETGEEEQPREVEKESRGEGAILEAVGEAAKTNYITENSPPEGEESSEIIIPGPPGPPGSPESPSSSDRSIPQEPAVE